MFFLLTTNGFAVNINYCCGKIHSVTLAGKDSKCKPMKNMPGCCKHEQKYIKLKVHTVASAAQAVSPAYNLVVTLINNDYIQLLQGNASSHAFLQLPSASPPGKPRPYLLNCSILV